MAEVLGLNVSVVSFLLIWFFVFCSKAFDAKIAIIAILNPRSPPQNSASVHNNLTHEYLLLYADLVHAKVSWSHDQ